MTRRTLAWLALNHLPGAGAVTLRRLASRFGSPEGALEATLEQLAAIGSLSITQARELRRLAADVQRFERLADSLTQSGGRLLTLDDDEYPANLQPLRDAPPLLYLRGSIRSRDEAAVAIVGTRTPSEAGEAVAQSVAEALAARGVTVVSGLARGIDAAAHRGALAAGRTIAVLGSGIDRVTPRAHRSLAEKVAASGALMSEVPPGTGANRETLLARNRIQAGLAKAVIVAQCRSRGGSFATARRALATGRQVLALLWDEPEYAEGTQRLAMMGARAVSGAEAIEIAANTAFAPPPRAPQAEMAFDSSHSEARSASEG